MVGPRSHFPHLPYILSEGPSPRSRFWHLNESLLQIPEEVLADVTKEITLYFRENYIQDCDPGSLWEEHKMVLRGILIKHGAQVKKEHNVQLVGLLNKLSAAESRPKHAPSQALEIELGSLRRQVTDLLHYRAKAALQFSRKLTYESGDKCGKTLAITVRELKSVVYIPQITGPKGQKATTPTQVS